MRHQQFLLIAASAATLTISQSTMAAGFAVSAQSAYGMGNAYAGNAAVTKDASTVLTNPAGIFELSKSVFGASVAATASSAKFTDKGSLTNPLFGAEPIAVTGGTGSSQSSTSPSPGIYYARTFSDKWAMGLALNVPFATNSEYEDNWIGRYHAVKTEVTAFDINPTVAYRINDTVSIGGGLTVQFANALLTSKLDSGATCLGIASGAGLPITSCSDIGLLPNNPELDSDVELDGSGTALTFNFGILVKPKDGTKIGVAYRHGTQHKLKGDATFTTPAQLAGFLGAIPEALRPLQNTGDTISADLPATFDVSVSQMANEKLELLGTLKWTQWSSFDKLTSTFDNPAQPESALPFAWKDTIMASAGMNYSLNQKLTLRAGFAYDQTPIPNPQRRSPRGPANSRYWYSVGGTYQFTNRFSANLAFTHIEINQSAINNPGSAGNPTLRGTFDIDANLFAFQLNWHFI